MATSMGRKRRRGVAVLGAVAALTIYLVGAAVPASATATCAALTGTAPNQTLTITSAANNDVVNLDVVGANIVVTGIVSGCAGPYPRADASAIVVNADVLTDADNQTVDIDGTYVLHSFHHRESRRRSRHCRPSPRHDREADAITVDLGDGDDNAGFDGTGGDGAVTVNGGAGNDLLLGRWRRRHAERG